MAIFNDSRTLRARLRLCVEAASDFRVVLEAEDGRRASQRVAEARADLVLMDVIMPHVDGYEATREIMQAEPMPIVIVTAALNPRDSAVIFRALAAGALYVTGPPGPITDHQHAAFLQLLRAMVEANPREWSPSETPPAPQVVQREESDLSVIAIVGSAGGPQALTEVLHGLPPGILPPVMLVQHMTASFEASFASWLASTTRHRVVLAEQGMRAESGAIYLAKDGQHLTWSAGRVVLSTLPPVNHFRPSATVLLQSLVCERQRALGVVLSGMGTDGADGAEALHRAGGYVVVQSRASAAVWGMPGEVVRRGAADAQLSASEIARQILVKSGLSLPG